MAKRCGCSSECACYLSSGPGIAVSGGGSRTNPYVIESNDPARVLNVQDDNLTIVSGVSMLDFQGGGVSATPGGSGEVVVTIPGAGPGGLTIKDEGTNVQAGTQSLNFIGAGVQATVADPTTVNVTVPTALATAAGLTSVPFANVTNNRVAVTFPAGRFTTQPAVTTTPHNSIVMFGVVFSVTSTGCQVGAAHRDGSLTTGTIEVFWIARAMG